VWLVVQARGVRQPLFSKFPNYEELQCMHRDGWIGNVLLHITVISSVPGRLEAKNAWRCSCAEKDAADICKKGEVAPMTTNSILLMTPR